MVVVTRDNFQSILPEILGKLRLAVYVSFDEEMSGIEISTIRNQKSDSPEDRYKKMVRVASKYSIIQFGICIFMRDEAVGDLLVGHPYTFFVFPDQSSNDISLNAATCAFLRRNNMDFGLWIAKGINFVNREQAAALRLKAAENDDQINHPPTKNTVADTLMPNKDTDIAFINEQKDLFKGWLDSDESRFTFAKCNSFLRRCLYSFLEANHPELRASKGDNDCLIVCKMDDAEKRKLKEENAAKLQDTLGMRLLFEALVQSGKPLVGHNCLFDLMFMLNSFEGELAEDLMTFRLQLHALLPTIYDTKYISTSGVLGAVVEGNALGDLYKQLFSGGDQTIAVMVQSSEQVEQMHDAGYDAFMTGACFAKFLRDFGDMDKVHALCNGQQYLMQSLYNLSLRPFDPLGSLRISGTVFHLSQFAAETRTSQILEAFRGSAENNRVEVIWIDQSNAFVAIQQGFDAEAMRLPKEWKLQSHASYLQMKNAPAPLPTSPWTLFTSSVSAFFGYNTLEETTQSSLKKRRLT